MSWVASTETALPGPTPSWTETAVAVVDPGGLGAMGAEAQAQGFLWVRLTAPGPQHRGRLGLYIEECIEAELEERGALPPGIHASTGLGASLSDQLYRARLVERRGIALGIPSLEGITNLGRTLDADDSGVLRWWMAATAERPVRLVLSAENMRLRVYPSPVFFESLFEVAPAPVSPRAPSVEMAESAGSMALSDLPPDVEERELEAEDDGVLSFAEESVELPELDRALGLVREAAPLEASATEAQESAEAAGNIEAPEGAEAVRAMAANIEAASAEAENTEAWGESAPSANESASVDAISSSNETAPAIASSANEAAPEDAISPPADEEPAARSFEPEVKRVSRPFARSSDSLDPEEFLRVLEEDSAKAPRVTPTLRAEPDSEAEARAEADEPRAPSEPTPLPTKAIRRPFIRLAEPEEVEPAEAELAPEPEQLAPVEAPARPLAARAAPSTLAPSVEAGAALEEPEAEAALLDENDPFVQLARRDWKTWAKNLEAARGPKPLAVVERMFVTDYTRLREAVRRGVADRSASAVLDAWQESFATSYAEAFDALRVRGKRPTMVLDVPELAQRLGRLQGARRVQLLLVDALRFDLGLMVQDRLRARVDAALTERLLLWSALPSITTYQLELLGKGAEGLKENPSTDESPALVARGRAAFTPRRIRTGRLELFKIDVVEDALREPGLPVLERLPEIAERTAVALADHLSKQAPRTLVLVFGDHGFTLDPKASGTTAEVRQGGSSPEEVLVPAFAWLTGQTH